MADFDLVIRGGAVIDGTSRAPVEADVAIKGGKIAHVGTVAGRGAEEIAAKESGCCRMFTGTRRRSFQGR